MNSAETPLGIYGVQGVASSNPATPTIVSKSPEPKGSGLFCFLPIWALSASALTLDGRSSRFTLAPLRREGGEIKSPWWLCPLVGSEGDGHEGATTAQRPTMGKETP